MGERTCSIPGCEEPHYGRDWCHMHYQRWWNHGDPTAIHNNRGKSAEQRFEEKVVVTGSCWLWTGTTNRKGYGMFQPAAGLQQVPVHRWSYEHHVGPIPEGLQLDHLCRVRHCVRPDHLEPVTNRENQARSPYAPQHRTHCPQGHPYDAVNTRWMTNSYGNPSRACRPCHRLANQAYKQRLRDRGRSLEPGPTNAG